VPGGRIDRAITSAIGERMAFMPQTNSTAPGVVLAESDVVRHGGL
jgi:hypothetical protein